MRFTKKTYRVAIDMAALAERDAYKNMQAGYGQDPMGTWLRAVAWRHKLIKRRDWNRRWRKDQSQQLTYLERGQRPARIQIQPKARPAGKHHGR